MSKKRAARLVRYNGNFIFESRKMGYSASLSKCGKYRYQLCRMFPTSSGLKTADSRIVAFIGLNPSTADEVTDDPTVRRCMNYARSWGYWGMELVNLFAYRATSPKDMMQQSDPVGPDNNEWISSVVESCDKAVLCCGNQGNYIHRLVEVLKLLKSHADKLHYLKKTRCGLPAHPLYLRKDLEPVKWIRQSPGNYCI